MSIVDISNKMSYNYSCMLFHKTENSGQWSDKKRLGFFFCMLCSMLWLLSSPAYADVGVNTAAPADLPEKRQVAFPQHLSLNQAASGKVMVAAELASDMDSVVSAPNAVTHQSAKNADPLFTAVPERQEVIQMSSENPEKNKPPLIDNSHESNKTALKAIEKNVVFFKDRIRARFSVWLERSAKYIEIMKDILREKKMPEELVFLPIVESGFNLNAYSSARAVGPWQFIASTAKRYGLVIDWWRDERKDPVKSTKAAASYLKDLYKMFGSWNLALAAYNAGEGRISKALKRSDADDYWSLLNTKQIRNETKEYVPRYIAATMIANTPEDYGFYNLAYHEPMEYDEVVINSPLDIEVIAQCAETTIKEIRELNPELRRWSTPLNVSKYTIRIPEGSTETFFKKLSDVPAEDHFTIDTYTVRKGDSLKKIAKKTGVPANVIIAMNSLSGIERLSAGEKINIPPKDKYAPDLDDKNPVVKASHKKRSSEGKRAGKGQRAKQGGKKSRVKTKKA